MRLFSRKPKPAPTAMDVEIALLHGKEMLCRGTLHITAVEQTDEFRRGAGGIPVVRSPGACDMSLIVINHHFEVDVSPIAVLLYEAGLSENTPAITAGIGMSVHASNKWESVALGSEYSLGFRCAPVTGGT
jgi:hypothetical protein